MFSLRICLRRSLAQRAAQDAANAAKAARNSLYKWSAGAAPRPSCQACPRRTDICIAGWDQGDGGGGAATLDVCRSIAQILD